MRLGMVMSARYYSISFPAKKSPKAMYKNKNHPCKSISNI